MRTGKRGILSVVFATVAAVLLVTGSASAVTTLEPFLCKDAATNCAAGPFPWLTVKFTDTGAGTVTGTFTSHLGGAAFGDAYFFKIWLNVNATVAPTGGVSEVMNWTMNPDVSGGSGNLTIKSGGSSDPSNPYAVTINQNSESDSTGLGGKFDLRFEFSDNHLLDDTDVLSFDITCPLCTGFNAAAFAADSDCSTASDCAGIYKNFQNLADLSTHDAPFRIMASVKDVPVGVICGKDNDTGCGNKVNAFIAGETTGVPEPGTLLLLGTSLLGLGMIGRKKLSR